MIRNNGGVNKSHKQLSRENIRQGHSPINTSINYNQTNLNEASNNELKQIIQKLIIKSRSLITSLESNLKQLETTRSQKDYWKNHYFQFKVACQKYIQSRGLASFQYITELQKTLKQKTFKQQEFNFESSYKSLSATNIKPFSFSVSQTNLKQDEKSERIILPTQNIQRFKSSHSSYRKQAQESTQSKTLIQDQSVKKEGQCDQKAQTFQRSKNQDKMSSEKVRSDFKGIKLGGSNKKGQIKRFDQSQRKQKVPQNQSLSKSNLKTRSYYKRKDSLQTKKIELFSNNKPQKIISIQINKSKN